MSDKDELGRVPLHYHAFADLTALRRELKEGADPNATDDNDYTPLHFAAQEGCLEAAEALIAAGAIVDAIDVNGNTPLFTAVMNFESDGQLIKLLRRHGADPLLKNHADQSPVGLARLIENYSVAECFADLPTMEE